jgi:rhamnosyltransferase
MTDKIALGFILFNPTADSIKRIIYSARSGYEIFIYLNSKLEDKILADLNSVDSINIFGNNSNDGLAIGLSSICNAAYGKNYKALLNFDQDSIFTDETLRYAAKYFNLIQKNDNEFTQSIVCTTFRDRTSINMRYNHISTTKISEYLIENIFFSINSGSLYFLGKIKHYNWFDKSYFVDGVDYSFCITSKINKFKITEIYNTPGLDHETEQGNFPIRLLKKQVSGRLYPLGRNIDFIKSHCRLLLYSFRLRSFKPKVFIIRSLFLYLYIQILFRLKSK